MSKAMNQSVKTVLIIGGAMVAILIVLPLGYPLVSFGFAAKEGESPLAGSFEH